MKIRIVVSEAEEMYGELEGWAETENGYEKIVEVPHSNTVNAYTIERLAALMGKVDELMPSDVLNRKEYIAGTLWSEDDIADRLDESGYDSTDENIAAVLETMVNSGALKRLNECLNEHWNIIDNAINQAKLS